MLRPDLRGSEVLPTSRNFYPVADPLAVSVIGIGSSAAVLPGAVAAFIDVVGTVAFGAVEGEWLGGIWQSKLM